MDDLDTDLGNIDDTKLDKIETAGEAVYSHNGTTQSSIGIDSTPVNGSDNLIRSNAVYDGLALKSDTTHNHNSLYSSISHNHDSSYSAIGHNHNGVYEPIKGADDNYVTDAEKIVIGNTSGINTGDQSASDFDIKDLTDSTNLMDAWSGKQDALTADTDYLTPTTAASTYSPTNHTHNANSYDIKDLADTTGKRAEWDAKIDGFDLIGSNIAITDTADYFTGNNAEEIFAEIGLQLDGVLTLLEGI